MGKRGLYFAGWCFAGALATISYSATWYVDDATDPSENGSSLHPFDAIQEGLDVATNGDTVLVRNGTYRGAGDKFGLLRKVHRPTVTIRFFQYAHRLRGRGSRFLHT